jgi:cytochrome c peroxidase
MNVIFKLATVATFITTGIVAGCGGSGNTTLVETSPQDQDGTWVWNLPAGFPQPAVPIDNPMSEAKFQLGRYLFYDKRLSGNGQQSCASCHEQAKAFTDGRAQALGSTGELHPRSAQPLMNVAYHPTITWANPSLISLESQMTNPMFGENPVEMGINDHNKVEVLARFQNNTDYVDKFKKAFPSENNPITYNNIIKSIATFQRALISGDSKYDLYQRNLAELTPAEERGRILFSTEKAECFHCHGSFNFNDQVIHANSRIVDKLFHNTGLYNLNGIGDFPFPNRGVFEISGLMSDMGAFRAQTLRNIAVTAPYMHDGSIPTLEAVVDFYAAGGRNITEGPYAGDGRKNPYKSELISRIDLSEQDKSDLVAFLKTLTDEKFLTNPRFSDPFTK